MCRKERYCLQCFINIFSYFLKILLLKSKIVKKSTLKIYSTKKENLDSRINFQSFAAFRISHIMSQIIDFISLAEKSKYNPTTRNISFIWNLTIDIFTTHQKSFPFILS